MLGTIEYTDNGFAVVQLGENTALAAVSAAAAAASAAFAESVSGPTYASQALGEAATVEGEGFAVNAGSNLIDVYLRTAGGSTFQRRVATTAALAASGGAALIGNTPAGTIAAVTVQGAINEIVSDLAASSGSSTVGFLQSGTGAVARTAQTKMRELISVKDFGAVGNNSTDDTVAIQNALVAATGGECYFPEGSYRVTGQLTMPGRTQIVGDGPTTSLIYYRTSSTTANQLFYADNVDNICWRDIGLVCDKGAGSQETCAIKLEGASGSVTDIHLDRVYISNFQRYGILMQTSVYYFSAHRCRIIGISNAVGNGGTGTGNAYGVYLGNNINAIRITDSRISDNDVAIESGNSNQKYSLTLIGNYFESNGLTGGPAEYDIVSLRKWSAVNFVGNYCEANLTGTAVNDGFLKLSACRGVNIEGNLFACAFGGVGKTKNAIAINTSTQGVAIVGNEFQDPITKYVYVEDGNSLALIYRNYYDNAGTPVVTYANIMAKMTANLVEIDVPHIEAVNTGSISAGANYQANVTILGVPLDRYCTVTATLQGATAADWTCTAVVLADDTVRLHLDNIKGSANTFNGNVVFRVFKNGSF